MFQCGHLVSFYFEFFWRTDWIGKGAMLCELCTGFIKSFDNTKKTFSFSFFVFISFTHYTLYFLAFEWGFSERGHSLCNILSETPSLRLSLFV